MTDISPIVGYINPVGGNDLTGIPNNTALPYKTIDGFYSQQRPLNPDIILTAEVTQGSVSMDLISYSGLVVTNPSKNASLLIKGKIGQTIVLNTTFFAIDPTLLLPKDLSASDVPVIRTEVIFFIDNGNMLVIAEENTDITTPNAERIIFEHTGTTDIREFGGNMTVNRPGVIHRAGVSFYSTLSSVITIPTTCSFYREGPTTIETTIIKTGNVTLSLNPLPVPPGRTVGLIIQRKGFVGGNGDLFLFSRQSIPNYTIIAKEESSLVSATPDGSTQITGGTIKSDVDGEVYLTNIPDVNITNLNLVNVIPFEDQSTAQSADYTLVQDYDSYNNSGSIFRRPHLITTDYTHTQFDGNVFMVDASAGNITITIPPGVVSNERLFQYKRIDQSKHSVTITSKNGIDGKRRIYLNPKRCSCKHRKILKQHLPYVELYGYSEKIYIFNRT